MAIVSESDQTTHTDILSVEGNAKICANADCGLLQSHRRLDITDLDRPATLDSELVRPEVIELIQSFPFKVFRLNEKLRSVYVFNSFLRAAGNNTLLSINR